MWTRKKQSMKDWLKTPPKSRSFWKLSYSGSISNFGGCSIRVFPPWNLTNVPSGKLTWQWKMDLLKMYSLLKMGMFYCYVSLPEGIQPQNISPYLKQEKKSFQLSNLSNRFVKSPEFGDETPEKSQKKSDSLGQSRGMNNYPLICRNYFIRDQL